VTTLVTMIVGSVATIVPITGCTDGASELDGSRARRGSSSGSEPGEDDPAGAADGGSPATSKDGGAGPNSNDSGTSPANGSSKPNCKYTAHKTGLTPFQQVGGLSFHVYAPSSYDPNVGHTVVLLMHGQDSNGVPELEGLWKTIADQEDLVLVAPKGSRAPTNGSPTGGNWAVADLNLILDLVPQIDDCYNVLTKKHLLWGFSAGTFYGYLLGLGAAEMFSGLAMGGANTSFAQQNGFSPSSAAWKIPVSHVHGTQDFNPISQTYQDRTAFQAAGHVFTLHEHAGGHSINAAQVRQQYDDLKNAVSP
jgi:poly(3-hydroxybutyrate) depolymerase